jgi:hypothetical protein
VLETFGRAQRNLGWQSLPLREHRGTNYGRVGRVDQRLPADDDEDAGGFGVTGRAAYPVQLTPPHSSAELA